MGELFTIRRAGANDNDDDNDDVDDDDFGVVCSSLDETDILSSVVWK